MLMRISMAAGACMLLGCLASGQAAAEQYKELYSFTGTSDGAWPRSALVVGHDGKLYGTASAGGMSCVSEGGPFGCGTVFSFDRSGKLTTLYEFSNGLGGASPSGLTLAFGKLVGSTILGGPDDDGTLFALNRDGTGFYTLHQFVGTDGALPEGPLLATPGGEIFGETRQGGSKGTGVGVLYAVTLDGRYKIVHRFKGGTDGGGPNGLVMDGSGNLFGSTLGSQVGGPRTRGTIFEYQPSTNTYSILYTFTGEANGFDPTLGAIGSDGTLYGTTIQNYRTQGVLFALKPGASGYTFTTLATFPYPTYGPHNPVTLTHDGSLVGATATTFFVYRNGQLSNPLRLANGNVSTTSVISSLTEGDHGQLYGVGVYNEHTSACVLHDEYNDGCGDVFELTTSP